MSGWSHEKRLATERAFYTYLDYCYVNSKDAGRIALGKCLYQGQRDAISQIFDALEKGIHKIYVLKSRQLGISTLIRALTVFLIGIHKGLKGAIVFDTDSNKVEARAEIEVMIKDLDPKLKFSSIASSNRAGLTLKNDSKILFMSAGVKKTKSSGTLGRSVGLTIAHCCMAPGTPVIVEHGKIKKIEDVRIGDRVVTHGGGKGRVVANVGRANDRGSMVVLRPWLGEPIICTRDHRIPTRRGMVQAGDIGVDDELVMPVRPITHDTHLAALPTTRFRFRKSGGQSAGSGLVFALDEEMGFAVGYYLAEGCLLYQRRGANYGKDPAGITFARHPSEAGYCARAIAALRPLITGSRRIKQQGKSLTVTETIYSASLARWLNEHFGALDDKRIPDYVFSWGVDFCRGLIAGLLCGDGSKTIQKCVKTPTRPPANRVSLSSTRASIAMQLRDLVASLGYGWGSAHFREAGRWYGRNCKEIWTVGWNGAAAAALRSLMGLPASPVRQAYTDKHKAENGTVFIKIKSITIKEVPFMYDLSVDHPDHTFRTPWGSVSNSELCSWDNAEGLEAFEQSLSDTHPDRLYIYESTARGFNDWNDMWEKARNDPDHCCCIFLGWWSKDSQRIDKSEPDFQRYGVAPPSDDEKEKIKAVKKQYGITITPEQLAWVRRKYDPAIGEDGEVDYGENTTRVQEQPWTEQEAFQQTGSVFFADKDLTDLTNKWVDKKPQRFMFMQGEEFYDMRIYPAQNYKSTELRVWEEPQRNATYVVGVDPAYGENDKNCNSAIQVLRCYADGVDQVAEYAWPLITTRHMAWALLALMAWYGQEGNEVRYILELNGPGEAVFNEIKSLKYHIENAKWMANPLAERGLGDIFRNVKTYIYARPDAMSAGYNWHWKTNSQLKLTLFERLRDVASNGKLRIRSEFAIQEMKRVTREGESVGAPGRQLDDRVVALALANYYWESRIRQPMIASNRTRQVEAERSRMSVVDRTALFNQNSLAQFFAVKRAERVSTQRAMRREAWRYGRRRW